MSQSQRHCWVQWHPHTPSLAKANATVERNDVPCPLTPCSPKSTVPLGWLAPLNCKLNYYSMALGWISQRLRQKATAPLSWIPHPSPKSTPPLGWISHPLPKGNGNVGFALLFSQAPLPWLHGVLTLKCMNHLTSSLDARTLFLKQYTKQTSNIIFTIFQQQHQKIKPNA